MVQYICDPRTAIKNFYPICKGKMITHWNKVETTKAIVHEWFQPYQCKHRDRTSKINVLFNIKSHNVRYKVAVVMM